MLEPEDQETGNGTCISTLDLLEPPNLIGLDFAMIT